MSKTRQALRAVHNVPLPGEWELCLWWIMRRDDTWPDSCWYLRQSQVTETTVGHHPDVRVSKKRWSGKTKRCECIKYSSKTGSKRRAYLWRQLATQVQVCIPENWIGERSHSAKTQSQQGPSLQPATSVWDVARDHTPESVGQPIKPHVTVVRRKNTISPSVFPTYQRSLKIVQPS